MDEHSKDQKTLVVFSGDLDKVMAAFIIAVGAASMGKQVHMFFTFWGLNALKKKNFSVKGKAFMEKMFGFMMPKNADSLALSKMHMLGMGTKMMKWWMKKKNVAQLPELISLAKDLGVQLIACEMSMDMMGISRDDLIDGMSYAGVAGYLEHAEHSNLNLFV